MSFVPALFVLAALVSEDRGRASRFLAKFRASMLSGDWSWLDDLEKDDLTRVLQITMTFFETAPRGQEEARGLILAAVFRQTKILADPSITEFVSRSKDIEALRLRMDLVTLIVKDDQDPEETRNRIYGSCDGAPVASDRTQFSVPSFGAQPSYFQFGHPRREERWRTVEIYVFGYAINWDDPDTFDDDNLITLWSWDEASRTILLEHNAMNGPGKFFLATIPELWS